MLEPVRIARAEEHRQAVGVAEISTESEPIGGGIMSFTAVGSWSNQASGVGMDGAVSDAELDRLVEFYASRGVEPQIEVAPYVDETLVKGLAARGFTVREFETVFARPVRDGEDWRGLCAHGWPSGVAFESVHRDDAAGVRAYAESTTRIFYSGADPVPEHMIAVCERSAAHPRADTFVAKVGGEVVAGGGMETAPVYEDEHGAVRVACLFGGAVREGFRGQGIQQALIALRLERAAQNGADVVCIHTKPGIPTERNALRLGFTPCYTKVVMTKKGEGLVPSP